MNQENSEMTKEAKEALIKELKEKMEGDKNDGRKLTKDSLS